MTPDEFRRHGREVVDWIADYWERVESLPVTPAVAPGDVRARLPAHPPERGEPFADVMRDLDRIIVPALAHWQSPHWFAFFPANTSPPSVLGEMISSGLGVQGMLWATSPAATELESLVLDWFAELLGLPAAFRFDSPGSTGGGVIQDTASSATLCALIAARERVTGGASNRRGLGPDPIGQDPIGNDAGANNAAADNAISNNAAGFALTAYASADAHSSVEKAMGITGLGRDNLRLVPTDANHAMRVDALADRIAADRAAGRTPCMVVATLGTTAALAFDPLPAIAALCRREGIWLHVDAAMAGNAAVCPEHRSVHEGLDGADSYCVNPHKWLLTNFDCDAFYVRDRAALVSALSILPEYLRNAATEAGRVVDYRDWQIPLGRRFRALKLWMVIRSEGAEGLRALVRRHVALAAGLRARVESDPRFELAAPVRLNLVCLRLRAGDEATRRLGEAVNATGRAYITHASIGGRYTLRVSIGQATTEARHVDALWQLLDEHAGPA